MLRLLAFCIALAASSMTYAQPGRPVRECDTNSGRVNLTEDDVLGPRMPVTSFTPYHSIWGPTSSPSSGLPAACQAKAGQLEDQWRQEDLANWETLANRACSAKQGWVENSPGICTAGGPPPICKRTDHWHRDSQKAMSAWLDAQQEVRHAREQQMVNAACGCWESTINPVQDTNQDSQAPPQSLSNSMVVPCSGSCGGLPGYVCRQGFCVPDTLAPLKGKATDAGIEGYKKGIETLMTQIDPELMALTETAGFRVLGATAAFLNPTPAADWGASYKASAVRVQQKLNRMRADLSDYRRTGYTANVWADRDDLQRELDSLNSIAAGLITERGLGADACYNVLSLQNSSLNASFALMFSKLPPRPQVGATPR